MIIMSPLYPAYLYSLDEQITISQLKQHTYPAGIDIRSVEQRCNEHHVQCMIQTEHNYHYKWHHIYNKPYIIYAIGNTDLLNKKLLGVVGPRSMTPYGERIVGDIMSLAASYDIATISGLAPGIDSTAHLASIQHNIPTIAILGGGLHYFLQQPTKKRLIQNIVDHGGLVLSEFKLKTVPTTYTFPQRNRIIAGLCDILMVPEAGIKSGSLITVDDALRLHKNVYGFPNSLYSESSAGLLEYIYHQKVRCVYSISDILKEHFESKNTTINPTTYHTPLSPEEQHILDTRTDQTSLTIEDIQAKTGYATSVIMAYVGTLELYGYIKQSGANQYQRL